MPRSRVLSSATLEGGRSLLRLLWVAIVLAVVGVATASPARAGSKLFVGFSDDGPKWSGTQATSPARAIGARAFRLTLRWAPGQTDLNATDVSELSTAVVSADGLRLVLSVYGTAASAPQDEASRTQFCTYVKNAVTRFPSINDVVIWNEPNLSYFWRPQFNPDGTSAAPAAYEALLARCWDILHYFRPTIDVLGPATSPRGNDNPNAVSNISHSPVTFIKKMGVAFRASGRDQRLFDTVDQHVYGNSNAERPFLMHTGTTISEGDWSKLVRTLQEAFGETAQPVPGESCDLSPCVDIWYLESGVQTTVPPDKLGFYTGIENVHTIPDFAGGEPDYPSPSPLATSAAPDQTTQLRYAVRLAYCEPYVSALFNFLLRDEPNLAGWQSGVLWTDWTPKASFQPLQTVLGQLNGGTVSCVAPSVPTGLTAQAAGSPAQVTLAWSASASPIGVSGYGVYRDGVSIGQTTGLTYTDKTAAVGATYSYTVRGYDAAGNTGSASTSVSVALVELKNQTITFGPLAGKTYGDPDFSVSATAASGLPVSFAASGNCTVSGATVHLTVAGSCTVSASQPGDANYNPAPDVSRTFAIAKAGQTITFGPLANKPYGATDFRVSATASSGLPVSFTASGSCTVSGATVHLIGAGSCTASALQPGDANYNPAPDVSRTFSIALAPCRVPKVVGKRLAAAKLTIATRHCRTGKVGYAYSKTVKRGRVISQKPRPRTVVPNGAKVNLVVSRGSRR